MGRSMTNQVAQLQKEVTPGTAVTNAMSRPLSLKLVPSYHVEGGESINAAGYKVPTAYMIGDVWSTWNVEGIQDFNALGLIAASVFGPPVTTPVGGSSGAYTHVFTPDPDAADTLVTYTAQFGDTVKALQASMFAFQSLGLSIQRGQLGLTSSAISRKVDKNATLATTGVTTLSPVPVPSRGYNVYADDTWATLGTTKLLACYNADISNPDKFVPDAPINSAIDGFESLMEAQDMDYTANFTVGFDAAGAGLIDSFENESMKFFRVKAEGPTILATVTKYSVSYDIATRITSVGELTTAPNSPTLVLPLEGKMILDPVSGFYQKLTIVNTVASY